MVNDKHVTYMMMHVVVITKYVHMYVHVLSKDKCINDISVSY